jgi:hypothetical protein
MSPRTLGAPALRDFIRLLREIFTLAEMGGNFASKMRGWLEAARLEKVEDRLVDCKARVREPKQELVGKSINWSCEAIDLPGVHWLKLHIGTVWNAEVC